MLKNVVHQLAFTYSLSLCLKLGTVCRNFSHVVSRLQNDF